MVEVDAYIGEIVDGARQGRRSRQHLHLRHLRQWPADWIAGRTRGYTPFRGAKASPGKAASACPASPTGKGMITPGRQSDELSI